MDNFWSIIWLVIWSFFFVAVPVRALLHHDDLFRDRELSGWWKALWIIFLIFMPYPDRAGLHHRPRSRHGRAAGGGVQQAEARRTRTSSTSPGRRGGKSAAEHIADAKALLDNGTINQAEFDQLKAKALA